MTRELLALLMHNEQKLHHRETRSQRSSLEKLLHQDFFEIGRSGQRYDREVLDDTCVLLTYRSYTVDQQGGIGRQTLRTSLWVKSTNEPTDWQMRFHQGTPQMPDTTSASDRDFS
ncbi:hypothetical protein B2M27_25875 [Kluyvera intermedia]|uniref:DUF4440 domain-containing protein n=1 Tax=Kluyvera intermedia TaxID=61648 RepID=A0ABX3U876_KLUIN|nr:hypothetical protein [Kluyvera intermedia]ORJ47454.1 hypothetical protein B2M27_25875 [Kluyvera intermedia]